MVVVLMGVAGAGKTTVGHALARALGWGFVEGDAYHSPENVARMRRGEGLTEEDRTAWLARVRGEIDAALARGRSVVVACSALSRRARQALGTDRPGVRLVHLAVARALATERLQRRVGHFAPPALLGSQFAALEPPEDAITVEANAPVETVVAGIRSALALGEAPSPGGGGRR